MPTWPTCSRPPDAARRQPLRSARPSTGTSERRSSRSHATPANDSRRSNAATRKRPLHGPDRGGAATGLRDRSRRRSGPVGGCPRKRPVTTPALSSPESAASPGTSPNRRISRWSACARSATRSTRTGSRPWPATAATPDEHAEDLHLLISELQTAPVDIFASSGGAVNGLALVTPIPEGVHTHRHEPPWQQYCQSARPWQQQEHPPTSKPTASDGDGEDSSPSHPRQGPFVQLRTQLPDPAASACQQPR